MIKSNWKLKDSASERHQWKISVLRRLVLSVSLSLSFSNFNNNIQNIYHRGCQKIYCTIDAPKFLSQIKKWSQCSTFVQYLFHSLVQGSELSYEDSDFPSPVRPWVLPPINSVVAVWPVLIRFYLFIYFDKTNKEVYLLPWTDHVRQR